MMYNEQMNNSSNPTNYPIFIKGLTKSYGELKVLDGVNLFVEKGTMLALLGPNGAGKTTTVRILSTLLKPDNGEVFVNGFDVRTQEDEVRSNIGLTGQYAAVDEYLTGSENLIMMGRLYHLSKSDSKVRAQELLEQFDLVDAANRPVKTYSGGMKRRLDLAASLIATPPVVFLDEPTTGLDPRSRLAMWKVIRELMQSGVTILLTTQYLDEADQLADKIAVIDGGKVIAQGTADELKQKVGKERLELVFKNTENFSRAAELVSGEAFQKNEEDLSISIAIDSVKDVKKVLDLLENSRIEVESLEIHKPTLDDVFLQFTGRHASKENSEESK
jgi:ABC-2 type transport system ATP-binding protein